MNPRYRILSTTLALTAAAGGCGGSGNSQSSLPISESNATSVAAEVLITGQSAFPVQLPGGFTPGVAATLRSLDPGAMQRLTALATGPQNADGTMTVPCAAGGSATITTTGPTMAEQFNDCVLSTGKLNGTLRLTLQALSNSSASVAASLNLTITVGSLSFTVSSDYTIVPMPQNPSDNTSSELTGDSLNGSLSVDGKLRDQVTLSSFDIGISVQLDSTTQQLEQVEHFTYDVDSSRLKGHITAMTTQDLKQVFDAAMPHHPFAGQILISGTNHTRLQITILGDETFAPPAGQGQIELQVDPSTGTFGAPIWTNWSDLSAIVMGGP